MAADSSTSRFRRQPIVGVMGSGSDGWEDLSAPLGTWLARRGVHLLCGGGGGVMASVARAFAETPGARGSIIGVLPGREGGRRPTPPTGYPNPWVEIPIRTHLPLTGEQGGELLSRNHVNVLSSDVVVALPGGAGTRTEVLLALDYGIPTIALLGSVGSIEKCRDDRLPIARTVEDACAFVDAHLLEFGHTA